jgi:hypothetical protein
MLLSERKVSGTAGVCEVSCEAVAVAVAACDSQVNVISYIAGYIETG